MIFLTRLNGTQFGINADLIERVETTGDTVVWLIDGTRFVISNSPAEVLEAIIDFRGRVLAGAERAAAESTGFDANRVGGEADSGRLRLVVEQSAVSTSESEGR